MVKVDASQPSGKAAPDGFPLDIHCVIEELLQVPQC